MTNETNQKNFKKRVVDLVNLLQGRKVTILGHDNIDVDAALSGILLSKLFDFLGSESEFCILEPVKENDTYEIVTELIGINLKKWEAIKEDENRILFLVDHYETVHSGTVLGCIDHHPTLQKKNYDFMYVRNSCATAYLIYDIMKEVKFPIDKEIAKMIVVSMMVDTTSFRSSKTIREEVQEAIAISNEFNLNYEFLEKYCLCLTEIEKLSTEQIITNGQKWYNYSGYKVGSAYLQLYGLPDDVQLQKWINALKQNAKETSSDMLVLIIFETKENKTYEYQITSTSIEEIIHDGILSRGKDIMPQIEKKFSSIADII